MKYTARNTDNGIFVYDTNGIMVPGGPYKTDEAAKRRIRDLKRKDEAKALGVHGNLITPTSRDDREAEADLGADMIGIAYAIPAGRIMLEPSGHHISINRPTPITRQIGCYPAIPKRAYIR